MGAPMSLVLVWSSHDISNNPLQSHHYRPLPHIRPPINISINTIPGSQTQ